MAAADRYRWAVLGVGTGAQGVFAMTSWGIPVLAPTLRNSFSLDLPQVGVALASVNIGLLAAMLAWGVAADRFGERAVMAAGLGASGSFLLAAAYVHEFAPFVGLLFAAGAGGASVNAASGRAIMGWFPQEGRGFALGIRQMAQPLGGAVAALVLPGIVSTWGVATAITTLGAGCLSAAVAVAVWMRDPADVSAPAPARRHPLRDARIWRVSFGSGLLAVTQTTILSFVVLFLHGERGLSTHAAGAVLALIEGLAVALRVVSGVWSDRIGTRMRPLRQLAVTLSVALIAVAGVLHMPNTVLLPTLVACGSLALGWNTLSYAATAELAGRGRSGAALGLQQSVLAGSVGITPIVFAALIDSTSWRTGYAAAAALPLVALLLFLTVDDTHAPELASEQTI